VKISAGIFYRSLREIPLLSARNKKALHSCKDIAIDTDIGGIHARDTNLI